MDLCVINWEIVTTILCTSITAGVAWHISNQWSKQKKGEIIADEARSLIKEIFELNKLLSRIKNYEITDNELKGVIEDLGYLKDIIKLKVNFLKDDIKIEDQQSLRALNNNLEIFYEKIEHYKDRTDRPMTIMYLSLDLAAQAGRDYLEPLLVDIEAALTSLRNISLYKSLK